MEDKIITIVMFALFFATGLSIAAIVVWIVSADPVTWIGVAVIAGCFLFALSCGE